VQGRAGEVPARFRPPGGTAESGGSTPIR
jgi:hypothetical protein